AVINPFRATAQAGDPPNVVVILSDDQALSEMSGLPKTSSLIGGQGVSFDRAYITYPLCCPSRATILSGQYMHNTGVRGNTPPFGGWKRFKDLGTEAKALPTWLDSAGYYNVQVGKYMNGYAGDPPPIPPGWAEWYGKYSEYEDDVKGGRIYFNYRMREDGPAAGGVPCPSGGPGVPGEPFTCTYGEEPEDYQTDVLGKLAVNAIERRAPSSTPFFLNVDFNAPHSPYIPAPRHDGAYAGVPLPKLPGVNEKNVRDKPRFLRRLPRLGRGKLNTIIKRRRARLEMLLSLDDQVENIVGALDDAGELDNTYIVFLSDNGYFGGEHRIRQGKYLPHEQSSHVPLMIRGPGIPAGSRSSALVSNADIAPTIAQIAGASPTLTQDGSSLLPLATNPADPGGTHPILLEGDTGPSIDDDGVESPVADLDDPADRKRLKAFYKKLKAQKRKLKARCKQQADGAKKQVTACYRRGVRNLDQEPTDTTYSLKAPAYSGIRTDRWMLTQYATGEIELYDMSRDPFQLSSLHATPRFKPVRDWLLERLAAYRDCKGAACRAGIGAEVKPLKKKRPKQKRTG
ncbi:MAG TPA: sulfatase, partial [Solirubrobacterales bacterium]|nr:sulfatase [Solirubrobacterales bacterium]